MMEGIGSKSRFAMLGLIGLGFAGFLAEALGMSAFLSCELLLAHAQRHIEKLKDDADVFSRMIVWKVGTYPIENGMRQMLAMVPDRKFPLELSLPVFDAVNALRSALDHAAYASTVALGKAEPKQTKFPFGKTKAEAVGDSERRGRDVPEEIMAVMLRFQPWEKGNPLLWGLNQLRNAKIHRLLVPAALDFDVWLARLGPGALPASGYGSRWDAVNGRLDLYSIPTHFDGEIRSQFRFMFDMTLGADGPLRGEPAVRGLNAIVGEVQRVLMAVEAETDRLVGK